MAVFKKLVVDWRYERAYIFKGREQYPFDIMYYEKSPSKREINMDKLLFAKRNRLPLDEITAEITEFRKQILHNETEPSKVEVEDISGQVVKEEWYFLDKRHREYGKPAYIEYKLDGSIKTKLYYNHGKQYFLQEKTK